MKKLIENLHVWLWEMKYWLLAAVFSIFPIKKNKIVFVSYYGNDYGDNGKYIVEELKRRNDNVEIVWILKKELIQNNKLPENVRPVAYRSVKSVFELQTAAVWIDNARKTYGIKRKNQIYIQTWHGMVALKRIEKDAEAALSSKYVRNAKRDSKMADVILSGCDFFTKLCKNAFWYKGEILKCGSPRLDVLFHQTEEKNKNVKNILGIDENKKVVLYAPTFRSNKNTECYIQNYEKLISVLEEKTGEGWVFLVRLHPNVSKMTGFVSYSEKVINVTDYPDLYELIPLSDIVISDYSSLMFDSALILKPVFLYTTDISEYIADRNFYFDIEKLPFPLAHSMQELLENIVNFDEQRYRENVKRFNGDVGYYENGTAAATVVDRILKSIQFT